MSYASKVALKNADKKASKIGTLIFSASLSAMGLFDFLKIDVLTEINGVVTLAGEPVSGAKVGLNVRIVFNDEKFNITTEADSAGRFHFDPIKASSINTFSPSAKMVNQKITITHDAVSDFICLRVDG